MDGEKFGVVAVRDRNRREINFQRVKGNSDASSEVCLSTTQSGKHHLAQIAETTYTLQETAVAF